MSVQRDEITSIVNAMTTEDRMLVYKCAGLIRGILEREKEHGLVAMALVGQEIVDKVSEAGVPFN